MKAILLFHEKRVLENEKTGELAIAELKIWQIPKTRYYPSGRKFSLFLVCGGKVLIGIDNHQPKGPHLHLGSEEVPYDYSTDNELLTDFWSFVGKAGFKP
jgi:hypothetical protein